MSAKMDNQPHILFLFTDQQRADCLGCGGHPVLRTPNMDRLASEGVRFTQAFTTSPLCVPARMSLTTGLHPHNNTWDVPDEDLDAVFADNGTNEGGEDDEVQGSIHG